MAPVANLVAAPLVSLATAAGGLGALAHLRPLIALGDVAAEAVLVVGRIAAPWPQVGWLVVLAAAVVGAAAWRFPIVRPPSVVVAGLLIAVSVAPLGRNVEPGTVVFLDIGQGDASLVLGDDVVVLIDGGPDPGVLAERLADWGVDRVDLLVISHVHADHIEGLEAVIGRMPVGGVWLAFDHQSTPASEWLAEAVSTLGIPVATPEPGSAIEFGGLRLEVLGPLRRYASPNDQSVVIRAIVAGRSVLFSGDVEVIAQRELKGVTADILKVPHQGAATSDPEWLAAVGAEVASISVGPNDFGHPADWVIEVLEDSGARVMRTDRDGDVVIRPDGSIGSPAWWNAWTASLS
jgi:competence protein ComEC